ncbi:MFS transporter [Glaciecola sp. MH2013]|uniref:glycoside-pentoside-hexuronide (GPH):cation symporter n=1 Tax=Glaciecola sp. MH2013 TaxID=2785524 RepID=UPI00189D8EE1|nr:glycoside-pentoside-hexuronide (GPH):cation symporter [Glaciecola sp. MH2013]MBF7071834.1 MFS transporter [Glaciecola sp. MH2013]
MQGLSVKEKFGYGLGDTASNIVFQVVIGFLTIYYTDVYGISAAAVGTLFLVVRIFDAITDPIMGGIADRTETRWGKYRPYLVWFALPYGALAVAAFTTPELSEDGKLIYAYLTYAALMTVYTAINIPYSALGGVMTESPTERASVQSWRFALAMVGGAIVTASVLPLVEYFGEGDEQLGYQMAMIVLSTFAILCFFACFGLTKERVAPPPPSNKPWVKGIWSDFQQMLRNDQWRIIAAISLIILISVVMRGGTTAYYVEYYLGQKDQVTLFMTSGMIAGIFGALSANFLVAKFCKAKLMSACAVGIVVCNGVLFFIPREGVELALVFTVLANYVHMIFTPLLFSAVPDTVDYGVKKLGQNSMAMAFSGHLLMIKMGIALGGAGIGWILAFSGYEPNVAQSESALNGILFLYSLASVIAGIIIFFLMRSYKLTRDFND